MDIIPIKTAKRTILLLMSGIFICTIHTVVRYFIPSIRSSYYSVWLCPTYHLQLSVEYYLYELEQLICVAIWFFAFGWAIRKVSKEIAIVCFLFLLYFITQIAFYIWNRNTSEISNYIVYIYLTLAVIYILIPKKKSAKIVHL